MPRCRDGLLLSLLLCLLFVCRQGSATSLSPLSERLVFEFAPAHEAFLKYLGAHSLSLPSSASQTDAIAYAREHHFFDRFIASQEFFQLLQALDSPINLYTSRDPGSPSRSTFSGLSFVLVNLNSISNCVLEFEAYTSSNDRRRQSSEEYANYMNGKKASAVQLTTIYKLRLDKLTHVDCAAPNIGGIELLFGTHEEDDEDVKIKAAVLRGHDKGVSHGQHSIIKQQFLMSIAKSVPEVLVCAKPKFLRRVTHRSVSVLLYDYLHWWLEHKPDCSAASSHPKPSLHVDPSSLVGAAHLLTKMADVNKLMASAGHKKLATAVTGIMNGPVPVRKVRGLLPPLVIKHEDAEDEEEHSVSKVVFHHDKGNDIRKEEESPDAGKDSGSTPLATPTRGEVPSAQKDPTEEPEPEE